MPTRIAIVDDSEVALQWARLALEGQGFEVATYSLSLGIQSFVRRVKPSLLLLDVGMPALSGDAVCGLLKSKPETKDILVVLYSSLPEPELAQRANRCGADGYIVKGREAGVLVSQVRALLERADP